MKLIMCNSKKWFNLSETIRNDHEIYNFANKEELTLPALQTIEPDIVFFPHWSWIVEKEIFNQFNCIIFHTAPLPYGRGGSPIQNLIKRGYLKSPVCALRMSDGIDNGPIYDREVISLDGTLSEILKRLNCAVNKLIERLVIGLPEPNEQVGEILTFKRLGHEDNEISFDANLREVYDAIRMLDDPSYPSAYIRLKNITLEFSEITKENSNLICKVLISNKDTP